MREPNKFQGTGAYWNQRTGKLTASRMAAAMSFLKSGGESSERRKLKIEILAERLTLDIVPKYQTAEMAWGVEQEPFAKEAFENKTGLIVTDLGFVDHPLIDHCGASPDGLVSDGCLIEIKCPSTGRHLEYILAGVVPEEYKPQMILQAACTGKKAIWFVSFDPRLPEKQQLFIKKYEPTQEEFDKVEQAAVKFLGEVDEMFEQITLGE
jgi:exodeoxyribonuclease (lambda-induced)